MPLFCYSQYAGTILAGDRKDAQELTRRLKGAVNATINLKQYTTATNTFNNVAGRFVKISKLCVRFSHSWLSVKRRVGVSPFLTPGAMYETRDISFTYGR